MTWGVDKSGDTAIGGVPSREHAAPSVLKEGDQRDRGGADSRPTARRRRVRPPHARSHTGRSRRTLIIALVSALLVLGVATVAAAQELVRSMYDRVGDAVVRRMDAGADGAVDPIKHRQPDIVAVHICRWRPFAPNQDLFTGVAADTADLFRLDLVFAGLVNPPGPTGCCSLAFAPFQYGDHPVYGYVEIDVDPNANAVTGGELDVPQLMFLGNAGRFGGLPAEPLLASACARDASAFDSNIKTPPLVDRSGEDFHISLQGGEALAIQPSVSTRLTFGPGDVWVVTGRFLSRAHGYERFSFADTGGAPGRYAPIVPLRFAHRIAEDQTTVSLVYPLTNRGCAAQMGTPVVQSLDGDASNQNSVLEGLDDLVFGVINAPSIWRSDPAFAIIAPWGLLEAVPGQNSATQFLDPLRWRITVLVGGSYTAATNDAQFVWSDVLPDVLPGDFNGDGGIDWRDRLALGRFIANRDGRASLDADGRADCAVKVAGFGPNFSVFDVNADGIVDGGDLPALTPASRVPGDLDGDRDVDQSDFGILQACLGAAVSASAANQCPGADLDLDGEVDGEDVAVLQACARGSGVPADPGCWPPAVLSCPVLNGMGGARPE